jgi:hypothetical protein
VIRLLLAALLGSALALAYMAALLWLFAGAR